MNFTLSGEDYLPYTLYHISTLKTEKRLRTKAWIAVTTAFFLFGALLFIYGDTFIVYFYSATALILIITFPYFHKYRLKKQHGNFVKEAYKNNIGEEIRLSFEESQVKTNKTSGASTINYASIDKIVEIKSLYFIVLKDGKYLIIPKRGTDNISVETKLMELAAKLEIPFSKELDWKW